MLLGVGRGLSGLLGGDHVLGVASISLDAARLDHALHLKLLLLAVVAATSVIEQHPWLIRCSLPSDKGVVGGRTAHIRLCTVHLLGDASRPVAVVLYVRA